MKRIITVLVVVALIAAGWYFFNQYRANQQAEQLSSLQTVAAERGNLTATVGATGVVRANQTAILNWQTSGIVDEVYYEAGDQVEAGDLLASLRKSSLSQNIILAEADLVNARQALDDLDRQAEQSRLQAKQQIVTYEQQLKDAQYQLDNFTVPSNQADLDTVEALNLMKERLDAARAAFEPYKYYSSNNSTRQDLKEELDTAQADYNAAVKRLRYEYDVDLAQENLNQALEDYDRWKDGPDPADIQATETRISAAEAMLDLPNIEAPFSGTLTRVDTKPGDQVQAGTVAFRLDDLEHLLVDVQVSEVDINRIKVGQDVILTFDAIPNNEYQGTVTEVDLAGTSAQGIVDFTVTVELTNPDEAVRPGMTAAVNIIVNKLNDVLLVPNRAVRLVQGDRVVYVMQNGAPQPVPVTLGASSDTSSEVVDGDLNVGDPIVLNPPTVFEQNGPPPFVQR